jgi:cobalt-zinc-cadmium efflux system outer membrane protein
MTKKQMKNSSIALFALLFFFRPVAAESTTRFPDVLKHAVSQFPLVKISEQDQGTSRADFKIAQGGFDWTLRSQYTFRPQGYYDYQNWDAIATKPLGPWGSKFNFGYRRGFGLFPIYDEKFRTTIAGEMFGGVEFSLLRNREIDSIRGALKRNEIGMNVQDTNLQLSQLETLRQVNARYWDWFLAHQTVSIRRELLTLAESRNRALIERVAKGDLPRFEQEDNERAILQRKADVVIAERKLQKTILDLSLYYPDATVPEDKIFPLEAPFSKSDLEQRMEKLNQSHPEVKKIELQETQNQIDIRVADNQLLPKLDVQLQAAQDMGDGSKTLTPFGLEVRVGLEIPLQNRALTGRRAVATIQGDRLSIQKQFTTNKLTLNLTDTHQSLLAQYERFNLSHEERKLANHLEQGERTRFKAGESNLIFVNLREQTSAEAGIREAEAYANFYKFRTEYLIASGDLNAVLELQ